MELSQEKPFLQVPGRERRDPELVANHRDDQFSGQDADQLEARFLKHALAEAEYSEPGLIGEESAWEAVPGPTTTVDGLGEVPSSAATENQRNLASHAPRLAREK
jgi:hypothetical protein